MAQANAVDTNPGVTTSPSPYTSLVKQVQAEFALAWLHQNGKIQEDLSRLKLFNNQKRDKDLIGDPLMFSIFQTVLASLYNDKLQAIFEGREEGDEDTADNITRLADYDVTLMKKDILDYEWIWDTMFFSRGLVSMMEFDRSDRFMCPKPEIIDPMTFLRDPDATSVNGNAWGVGQMRFGGREILMTKPQMRANPNFFNVNLVRKGESLKSLIVQARQAKNDAQGLEQLFKDVTDVPSNLYGNSNYSLLEWVTHWKGSKVMVVLANNLQDVVRFTDLGTSSSRWKIVDRVLYPSPHSWAGVSIPDLTEDKQRQRSVALNLGLNVLKSDLYPSYIYNEKAIKNPQDLEKMNQFNKMIPAKADTVDVGRVLQPINKGTPNGGLLEFILGTMDMSAQKATASPDVAQGQISSKQRTLGELNLVSAGSDLRQSLSARVFGWSEREFWEQWYQLYKDNFKDKIDEKIIRVNGAFSGKWRGLTKENIVAASDPDVIIESKAVNDAKNYNERILLTGYANLVMNDPMVNKRYLEKKLGKINGLTKDELDRLLPPTIEELTADHENDMINEGKLPPINANDDHVTHLEIHAKAQENAQKFAHIMAHEEAMRIRRDNPNIFPTPQAQVPGQSPNANGQPVSTGSTNDIFNNPSATGGVGSTVTPPTVNG